MPIYEMKCVECQEVIEVIQNYHDERPKVHECGGELQQVFSVPATYIGPQTVGSLAERNAKGMSDDAKRYYEEKTRSRPKKSPKSFDIERAADQRREYNKKKDKLMRLGSLSPEKRQKYVETGEV